MKKEMGGRLARTRAALDALDDEQRTAHGGPPAGGVPPAQLLRYYALLCSVNCMAPAWSAGHSMDIQFLGLNA